MRTVEKAIKRAKMERKNPKQELNRLLRNYRFTPHSTTKVAPATALFGRPMHTKLPEVTTHCSDAEIQGRDRTGKVNKKKHADNKRYIKPSTVKEGDTVFIRRDDSKKKCNTPYDRRPLIVVEKKGSMVTAQDDSISITKNSSFFKSVPAAAEEIRNNPAYVTLHLIPQMLQCSPIPHCRNVTRTRPVNFWTTICLWLIGDCKQIV